jgi:hypothetical protein
MVLLIGWFLDNKNKIYFAKEILDRLFKKDLVLAIKGKPIINFLVYYLFEHYKENIVKIFDYLSDNDIYKICSLFIENKNDKIGLEIFGLLVCIYCKFQTAWSSMLVVKLIYEGITQYCYVMYTNTIFLLCSIFDYKYLI